jgi:hypothetical protein
VVDDPNELARQIGGYTETFNIDRNALGTELRLYGTTSLTTILVREDEVTVIERPTISSYPNSQGAFGEIPELEQYFSDDPAIVAALRGAHFGQSGVDSSGTYFFVVPVTGQTMGTLVGAIGDDEKPRGRFHISANGIFTKEREIYLCGLEHSRPRGDGTGCVVLAQREAGFEQLDHFYIPCCAAVIDVDPYSDDILAIGLSDLMPLWYIHNRTTGRTRRIGLAHRGAFFLEEGFFRAATERFR